MPIAIRGSLQRRTWGCTDITGGANAERERTDGVVHFVSPRSSALHRQADRAGHELRRSSRHRHRERAVAQRTAPAHHRPTERTADLTEALEQQTATSEVLQVISSSPGDLEPVFAAMLENAVRICDAKFGNIYRWDGEALHLLATHNTPPAFAESRKRSPRRPHPNDVIGRMLATKAVVTQIADAAAYRSLR